jgi:hypothetical protein
MDTLILKEKIHKLIDESEDIDLLERIEEYLEEPKQYVIPEHVQNMVMERVNNPNPVFHDADQVIEEMRIKFNL